MTHQMSFKMHQREVESRYRIQIDAAESTEDVRKFFERTVYSFLEKAIGDQIEIQPGDVTFDPDSEPAYRLSARMLDNESFRRIDEGSDLSTILALLSGRALNRYKHLATKHPDKTEAKIFQVPGPRSH
ncbi:hypothetical protein DSECCO2_477260 [anaerobic digester metagenome]